MMLSGSKWFFAFCFSLIIHASLGLSFYSEWNTPQIERSSGISLIIAKTQTSLLTGEINSRPETIQEEQTVEPKKVRTDKKKQLVEKKEPKPKTQILTEKQLEKQIVEEASLKQEQLSPISLPKTEQLTKTPKEKKLPAKVINEFKKDIKKEKKKKTRTKTKSLKMIGSARNHKKTKPKSRVGNQGRVKNKASGKAALSNYKGRLRSLLMRNVRSSRKSGTVLISFTISKSGRIRNLRIYKSSGNKKLDKLALNTAKRAAPFPPLPHGHKSLRVTAPIRFR